MTAVVWRRGSSGELHELAAEPWTAPLHQQEVKYRALGSFHYVCWGTTVYVTLPPLGGGFKTATQLPSYCVPEVDCFTGGSNPLCSLRARGGKGKYEQHAGEQLSVSPSPLIFHIYSSTVALALIHILRPELSRAFGRLLFSSETLTMVFNHLLYPQF